MALTKINNNTLSAITGLPAGVGGKVLQVVQATNSTTENVTSSSYVATNMTATITPSATSSKILIMANSSAYTNTANAQSFTTIYRGITNLSSDVSFNNWNADNYIITPMSMVFLDSPNTTSATTYTVYAKVTSGYVQFQTQGDDSTITLIEVAG
jgi:hypothetical protein